MKGATVCTKCPAGFFMDKTTMPKACSMCSAGQVSRFGQASCTPCDSGFYSKLKENTTCHPCSEGKYGQISGAWEVDAACQMCPQGRYSSAKGVDGLNGCNKCSSGKYGTDPGSVSSDAGCTSCPVGWFQSQSGENTCKNCGSAVASGFGPGFGNKGVGNTGCVGVPPGSFVNASKATVKCSKGFYCKGGSQGRVPCDKGTYASNDGSVECFTCAPGKFAEQKESQTCESCPKGWLQRDEGGSQCIAPDSADYIQALLLQMVLPIRQYYSPDCGFRQATALQFW